MRAYIVARDALAILGGLLVTWSLLVVLYTLTVRVPFDGCVQGQWWVASTCLNAWKWMLIPFSIGVVMTLTGLIAFRSPSDPPEEVLRVGAGIRMLLAVLASLALVPLAGAITVASLESGSGATYQLEWQDVRFGQAWFLLSTGIAGLVLFLPVFAVHMVHDMRRRRYLDMTEPPPLEAPEEEWEEEPGPGELPPEGFAWQEGDEPLEEQPDRQGESVRREGEEPPSLDNEEQGP